MSRITKKGRDLADSLNPSIGTTREIQVICSRICRLSPRYHRIQEDWCNRQMDDEETARLEAEETRIEKRVTSLCAELPQVEDKTDGQLDFIRPRFGGDPRGCTIILIMPDGRYDDWGHRGICVPSEIG